MSKYRKINRSGFISRLVKGAGALAFGKIAAGADSVWAAAETPSRNEQRESAPLPFRLRSSGVLDPGMERLLGLAIDGRDKVYVAGRGGVKLFDRGSKSLGAFATESSACCVVVDGEGFVYVGLRTRVQKFSAEGKLLATWGKKGKGEAEFLYITGIAADDRVVYVADAGNRRIHRFARNGDFVDDRRGFEIPSGYFDCGVDRRGVLHVGHTARHRVERYDRNGKFLGSWGRYGTSPEAFCGCCNPTHLGVFPDGRVATTEKGAPRLKVYDPSGRLLALLEEEDLRDRKSAPVSSGAEAKRPGRLPCHDGRAGMALAVDSRGRIALAHPSSGTVRFYSLTARTL